MIPVTLLTGFLGSGKTTVLNQLLKQLPLTAVVMNEFGEIGLDHQLLEATRGPLALLSGGCVCCQIQGALAPTLKNLWMARDRGDLPAFERLIIETTGLADPAPMVDTLVNAHWLAARYRLDGILTTVDAQFASGQLDQHFEAERQVAMADRLLLTKIDLASGADVEGITARLARVNPAAPLLRLVQGVIDPAELLGANGTLSAQPRRWLAAERYRPARMINSNNPADAREGATHVERIRAFSLRYDTPLEPAGVMAALEMLIAFRPSQLLRMKAILNLVGEPRPTVLHGIQHVLYPPNYLPAWPDDDRSSRLVFIVSDLEEAFVEKLFDDFVSAVQRSHSSPPGMA